MKRSIGGRVQDYKDPVIEARDKDSDVLMVDWSRHLDLLEGDTSPNVTDSSLANGGSQVMGSESTQGVGSGEWRGTQQVSNSPKTNLSLDNEVMLAAHAMPDNDDHGAGDVEIKRCNII
ncbi:hypothetical protein Ancab_021742 [Ancistrocladus abbreviatus]